MSFARLLEGLLVVLVTVVLPLRAWRRHLRAAPPSPTRRYVPETAALIVILGAVLRLKGEPLARVGLEVPGYIRGILDCLVCLAVVIGVDLLALHFTARSIRRKQSIAIARPAETGLGADTAAARKKLISFIAVTLLGATWEELCFRCWMLSLAPATLWGLAAAVVISTMLFGMQHLRNGAAGMAYSSFFGLMFACLYLCTRNLAAVIVAHFAGNVFAVVYGGPWIKRIREQQALRAVFLG
jgi:membrane protease YdiL (CAAX protease family)